MMLGGFAQAKPDCVYSQTEYAQYMNELTGGKPPVIISLVSWSDYVVDKEFHHGNIYSITPYAVMTYSLFISKRSSDEYACRYGEDFSQLANVPYTEGFSNNPYDRQCARLDSSSAFLNEKKPHCISLKGKTERETIEFSLQEDGGYSSTNAPHWEEFVMKWAYKFRGVKQELPEPLANVMSKTWSDFLDGKTLFGEGDKSLMLVGLISYMRIARNTPSVRGKSMYRFFQKGGAPISIQVNEGSRFLQHPTKNEIGEDEILTSFLKQYNIVLVVEQVGECYYLYERQEDGSYDMSNAPYWDAFMLEYGSLRDTEQK